MEEISEKITCIDIFLIVFAEVNLVGLVLRTIDRWDRSILDCTELTVQTMHTEHNNYPLYKTDNP